MIDEWHHLHHGDQAGLLENTLFGELGGHAETRCEQSRGFAQRRRQSITVRNPQNSGWTKRLPLAERSGYQRRPDVALPIRHRIVRTGPSL